MTSTSRLDRALNLFFPLSMVKCNQKMYDTISDFDFARIREGLVGGLVSESVTLFFAGN